MELNSKTNIGGNHICWDLEKGLFEFEEQDAVLFWISTAMKTFLDTIEEISGQEASDLVFETAGFRQGLVVGKFFEQKKNLSTTEIAQSLTNTYASAGWGRFQFHDLNYKTKTLTAHLKDSWEHKINVAQGKKKGTNFLPAHFAGVFTGLLGTNIWYKVLQYQLDDKEYSIIQYFPSSINVSDNIHQLARKKESEQIAQLEALVEEKTKELKDLVKKISSPIIPVLEKIVVVPLIGTYDEERTEELIAKILDKLPSYNANNLILDLTGLDQDINEHTVSTIEKVNSTACLIGIETILVGISPQLSMVISQSNINLTQLNCFQTLQHGIHYALAQRGRRII
ncbi:anti-anti-sigma regulatory factor [Bacillus oleivorans]|uniref:Anti-anti-sigma regulatory factor n=1 Tax=Bacillus oleivorans TaxID=1448271 RepID=A0A285CM82_9BACI|nr:STAS domain-containing protein [Bacillus oleivorans]SNX68641.1 anti-anti-sigma regulatory factor [Bacillus oleivorans]